MYLLFHIPNLLCWTTEQVANIINFFIAIGTVGAFLYAFYLERKNRKKINDLAEITIKLAQQNDLMAEQNKLQKLSMKEEVRPDFVQGSTSANGNSGMMAFQLKNQGRTATISNIEYMEDDVTFHRKNIPFILRKDMEINFKATAKDEKHINDCNWGVIIHYNDIYSNQYMFAINGVGGDIKKCGIKED